MTELSLFETIAATMAKSKNKRPIDVLRDSAKSIDIGTDDSSGGIEGFVSFSNRFLVVKDGGTYEVELADKIDPNRTNPNIPDTHKCLIRYGSTSKFISRSLLTGDVLVNEKYLRAEVSRDRIMPIVLNLASKFAQINDLIEEYSGHEIAAMDALERANKQTKISGSLAIPEVPNLDSTCKNFFIQAKHSLQDMLNISSGFFGDDLKRGFFSNLQDIVSQNYGEDDKFYLFLKEADPLHEFVRVARNCIEHEKPEERVIISNIRMNEFAEIVLPTFELVHPMQTQEEMSVDTLLHSVFSNLVEFSEDLLAHMVTKNMENKENDFVFDLIHFPDGSPQNPGIRYGFGVMLNGKLTPIG